MSRSYENARHETPDFGVNQESAIVFVTHLSHFGYCCTIATRKGDFSYPWFVMKKMHKPQLVLALFEDYQFDINGNISSIVYRIPIE